MDAILGIALFVACALALMALEAFIPGVSFAGIAGVFLFGVAAYLCWNAFGLADAAVLMVLCGILSFLIMRIVFRSMKSGKLSKSGIFMNDPVAPAIKAAPTEKMVSPGDAGTAKSALRPAGIADFDGHRLHVFSENGFIEKDEPVTVSRVEGAKIVVRRRDQ